MIEATITIDLSDHCLLFFYASGTNLKSEESTHNLLGVCKRPQNSKAPWDLTYRLRIFVDDRVFDSDDICIPYKISLKPDTPIKSVIKICQTSFEHLCDILNLNNDDKQFEVTNCEGPDFVKILTKHPMQTSKVQQVENQ